LNTLTYIYIGTGIHWDLIHTPLHITEEIKIQAQAARTHSHNINNNKIIIKKIK
jgi:hypothetical protein